MLSDAVVCCGVPFSFLLTRAMRSHNERDDTTAGAAADGQAAFAEGSSREEDVDVDDDEDVEELVDSTEWLLW